MIRLAAEAWTAELRPEIGGCLSRLKRADRDVLRPMPQTTDDPLAAASFPLVPYANRIDHGRFRFGRQAVDLGPTPGFAPHALHGDGWRSSWEVAEVTPSTARLTLEHTPDAWPWRWRAEQRLTLDADGLSIDLVLNNLDKRPMPAGVGQHPFFPASAAARLTVEAPRVWEVDDTLIPSGLQPADAVRDWRDGCPVDRPSLVDHCYDGWTGAAVLEDEGLTTRLTAKGASRLHVYVPPGESFLCLEPVSHRPDAANAPAGEDSGLVILQPGETLALSLRIEAELSAD